jgi:hypothetical protein
MPDSWGPDSWGDDSWGDEELMAALKEALASRQSVPPEFIEAGRNAFAWHNIDAEIAQLTYDSAGHRDIAPVSRSELASIRALTFTSAHLTIDLEVGEDSLLGQVIPARRGTIEVHTRAGVVTAIPVDELGYFTVRPAPDSPFRLHWQTSDSPDIVTGWITL